MRCWQKSILLVSFLLSTKELGSSGDNQQKIISAPDKPTRVFIGDNVSLVWQYNHPNHFTLYEVVFGIWGPGLLTTKLVAVNASGFPDVRKGYEAKVDWAGNLTSSLAVFVLYNVQPADENKEFGIHIEYDLHTPLTDEVRLDVVEKHRPRITYVTAPPLLRIGQNVSLNCTASGVSPIHVTWYKGHKVLASGISEAVFTLKSITDKDWGEFLCVAKNSAGEGTKSVILKVLPESPTILNTKKKIDNASWTLRWSAVYSEGHMVTSYTVWHRVVDNMTREKPWLPHNITGLIYHKELAANTSYMFAVTAWNRWGESLLERDKILSISTDFPDRKTDQTTILLHTEPETSVTPSSSNMKGVLLSKTELILYSAMAALSFLLILVLASYAIRRKRHRDKENNKRHQDRLRGITSFSFTPQEDLASEAAQETANERGAVILSETPLSMSASSLTLDRPAASVRNMQDDFNQPTTGECMTTFASEMNATAPGGSTSNDLLRTFVPLRGSERNEHNQEIHMSVIKRPTPEEENTIAMETNEAFQRVSNSEEYLQPVDDDNLQAAVNSTDSSRLCRGKAKTLSPTDFPQPRPRVTILDRRETEKLFQCKHSTFTGPILSLQFTDMLQENPLYQRETAAAQHCASVKPAGQSNRLVPQMRTRNGQHNYQNDRCTTTTYQNAANQSQSPLRPAGSGDTPYARVNCNTNWEVSRDRLTLFERIGGGSFGQVWKGAALDVAGAKGWSVVAVKMLKENSSKSDLRDLLSELDLLKKLKPHPNVIQLLGCLTKDVLRCKGRPDFRPPLVILEFVPDGDLLGYLRKSKGETDDYYNLRSKEVPRKIPIQQLYKFASDIARGMEFISAHQLIHRDLAARNVLVGKGLCCKITDFGMARDLRKANIYVMRSNGVVPVKWLAIESLTNHVYTTESDVWSYGIVLYEIFTLGGRLYEGMTGEEVFNYVASGRRLPRTSSMSSEVYNVMLQCWQADPSKRPTFHSIASWAETVAYDH